jgi:hypothetical protein
MNDYTSSNFYDLKKDAFKRLFFCALYKYLQDNYKNWELYVGDNELSKDLKNINKLISRCQDGGKFKHFILSPFKSDILMSQFSILPLDYDLIKKYTFKDDINGLLWVRLTYISSSENILFQTNETEQFWALVSSLGVDLINVDSDIIKIPDSFMQEFENKINRITSDFLMENFRPKNKYYFENDILKDIVDTINSIFISHLRHFIVNQEY